MDRRRSLLTVSTPSGGNEYIIDINNYLTIEALEDVLKQQGHLVNTQFQGMKMNTVKKYDGKAEMLHSKEPVKYTVTLLDKQTGKATNYKSYYTFTNF